MNDTTRPAHRLFRDGRFRGFPDPAVHSRPQALAGGRSSLPDVRRRPLWQRVDHLLETVTSGLFVVDPRSALLTAVVLDTHSARRVGRSSADALDMSGRRADA